jgi:NAD(P)-dependent dehydrogenase (short-subunit alcohol dehydrogenase family)
MIHNPPSMDLGLSGKVAMVAGASRGLSMQARGGGAILVSTSASVKEPIPNLGVSTVVRASVSALAKTLALSPAAAYMTGATVQVDGGLIRSVL